MNKVDAIPSTPGKYAGAPASGKFRYVVLTSIALGIAVNYMDRATMSVAPPFIQKDIGLTAAASGVMLSAFF